MIKKIECMLDKFEDFSMMLLMAVAITLTFTQVVMRYVFNAPLFWAEEVVLYSIICMSFVGISYGIKHQNHISVEVLKAFTPLRFQWHIGVVQSIVGLIFSLILLYLGWKLVSVTADRGQLSSALRIPIALIYLSIPISGASATFRYLHQLMTVSKEIDEAPDGEPLNMI